MKHWAALLLAMLLLCLTVAAMADNGRGKHKKVYAVPRQGKVTIDGKLDDWDLSGQIWIYVVQETADMQSAKYAMMYDADALYISGMVRDTSPMMNRHDPEVDPDKAWDADVCQLFLSLDPQMPYPSNFSSFNKDVNDKLTTLLLWHYTDRKEANMVALKGMTFAQPLRPDLSANGVIPRKQFQAIYRMDDDKRGYTFEYRIPWKTLGVENVPKAGDLLACTVCFFWGTPDGLKTAGGAAWAYDVMGTPGFPFQSSNCWGKLIFAKDNNLPKELVEEGLPPQQPLPLKFSYRMPEDADATVQLFDEKGMSVRTLVASGARRAGENVELWDGLDDTGKPLPAGTYTWKGLYHQPLKTKFILAAHNSGNPPYKLDDNTGGWGGDHGTATTACAAGDTMLLAWNMCESGWGIIRTDLKGKKLWGSKHNAMDLATDGARIYVVGDNGHEGETSVKLFDLADCRPLNWGNGQPALAPPPGGTKATDIAHAVAYANNLVYVSWTARNLIGIYEAKSGELRETWSVPAPERIAPRPDGSFAVISEGKVLAVRNGKAAPLVTTRLDDPRGLTVAADGTLYVANGGALQNVSVFAADGSYLRSIGKAGGRPAVGRYDKDGMLEPGGITLDKQGRLWVAELLDSPKRHSTWDLKTGAFVQEFFGGSSYFGWAYMDPKRPDEVYCHNVLWKVNLDTGACAPVSTIWRHTTPDSIFEPNPGGYAGHFRVITAKNGKQYGWGMSDYSNMLFMREGDIFKPIAGTIRVNTGPYGAGLRYPAMKDFHAKTNAPAYLWQDKDDDQQVQVEELVKSTAGRGEATFNWIDEELNAWCDDGYVFTPVSVSADGRPTYDFSKREAIPFRGSNSNGTSLWLDPDGSVYTLAPGAEPGIAKWTRDGKLIWGYNGVIPWPDALNLPMVTPGKLHGLTMPLGIAGDFTGASTYYGPYHIFTRDGLYVGMVMRDGRAGGLGADITASETITGQLVKPEGMNRYFLLAGDQDGRVTEILGLDTVLRLPGGTYTHTPADVAQATRALAEYRQALAKSQRLEIVRGKAGLIAASAVGKSFDTQRGFSARAAYDDKNLYVQFEVECPFELVSNFPDPNLLFKGGNCLDIQLATDPTADPKRKTPAAGDVRILVTRQKNQPLAVIYRAKVKDFKGEPIVLKSPTGQEPFDAIELGTTIGLDYKPRAGGFSATVTIPLALLNNMQPKPGDKVLMDLGYIFGNANGTSVAARAYWSNNGFSANVTNDVPNESRLEPQEWGTAFFE